MTMRRAAILICLLFAGACTVETPNGQAARDDAPAPFALAEPDVVMAADPAPPFTYWAPDGATIRNHPNAQGVWIAEVEGETVATYFGDECRASQFQLYVGRPLDDVPPAASGENRRVGCSTCPRTADLRVDRMDVSYDEESRRVVQIACG